MLELSRREAFVSAAVVALAAGVPSWALAQTAADGGAAWDLSEIYPTDAAWEAERRAIQAQIPSLLERIGPGGPGALALINAEINRQAVFIAYLDDFKLMMILTFAVLPLLLLMRKAGGGAPVMAAD